MAPMHQYKEMVVNGTIPAEPFLAGEYLQYGVAYMGVKGGTLTMEIGSPIIYQGQICYPLSAHIRSLPFFSMFFKVKDVITSIYNPVGSYSYRYHITQREGDYRAEKTIELDYANKRAVYSRQTGANGPHVREIDGFLNDSLSVFYDMRRQGFNNGMLRIPVISGKKVYDLKVELQGRETLNTMLGKKDTLRIKPFVLKEGEFKDKGNLVMWITDDAYRIPVLVEIEVVFGKITATLESVRLPKYSPPTEGAR